ncbi:MAG: glycoside hydrolase family 127 protein [Bacteroidales bacterium]|nr:glycoside hydrolase family 127 protein [Bacteroidales bacterium]
MKKNIPFILQALLVVTLIGCSGNPDETIRTDGPEVIEFKVLPFELADVKLLEGPFLHATELNSQSLLNYEPDRFLAKFLTEAGLEPKAEHYGGWESNTIAGHSLGHYLSAICLMYQTTGDERFLERAKYIVDELERAQEADGEGYIGAFPDGKRILEEEVARGDIRSKGFDLNGIWVPFYTEHKVMAGLFDAYNLCGIEKALDINIKFADWLETVVGGLNDSLVQVMLHCEHGGINESLAELYGLTGEKRYLEMSRLFHHRAILDSLEAGIDVLPGKHGNTQIPKLVGLARRYELTGDEGDRKAAEFFWERVVNHHSYVTGGHGNHEYFGPPDQLSNRLSEGTTETCNVYNMLKLSRHLFLWEASPVVADFYERALFNHILSSQHPGDGRVIYNLSLEMGGFKVYQYPYWFTCCIGTGMENHSKYARNIYFHNNRELYVSQFIASELTWKEKGLVVKQVTAYPGEQGTTLQISCEEPVELDLMIRYPYWAEKGITIKVNGKPIRVKESPGSFVRLSGTWENGDEISVELPFTLRLEAMPDNENRVAVMYGPLVMAGDLGPEDDPAAGDPMYVPIFLTDNRDPGKWFEPIEGETNTFRSTGIGKPADVTIKPFYRTHERRYTIYWDIFDEAGWTEKEQEYKALLEQKKKIEAMTIDFVQLGEMQPERDHNFKGENADVREFKGRKLRETRGGWFSVEMTVFKGQPMALVAEYWGGFPGSKTFDILVDGTLLATENISNIRDGEFVFKEYTIPDEMTVDKTYIEVKFKAHEGHMAGPVFSVRTIKR